MACVCLHFWFRACGGVLGHLPAAVADGGDGGVDALGHVGQRKRKFRHVGVRSWNCLQTQGCQVFFAAHGQIPLQIRPVFFEFGHFRPLSNSLGHNFSTFLRHFCTFQTNLEIQFFKSKKISDFFPKKYYLRRICMKIDVLVGRTVHKWCKAIFDHLFGPQQKNIKIGCGRRPQKIFEFSAKNSCFGHFPLQMATFWSNLKNSAKWPLLKTLGHLPQNSAKKRNLAENSATWQH